MYFRKYKDVYFYSQFVKKSCQHILNLQIYICQLKILFAGKFACKGVHATQAVLYTTMT